MNDRILTNTAKEIEDLESEMEQRMGRVLTRQEKYYLAITSAYSRMDREAPEDIVSQSRCHC
jgi:hypothetical protein